MNNEAIREWLEQRPFMPFVLQLSNGVTHEVRHPENVVLLKSRMIVGYPETDRMVLIALVHINTIEAMESSQAEKTQP